MPLLYHTRQWDTSLLCFCCCSPRSRGCGEVFRGECLCVICPCFRNEFKGCTTADDGKESGEY
ncbi:hypothetical protein BDQ17DRAFT_1349880 [Cyathus striatus]|nr:hypothetical protein BDQ17DRAFT_1349880 [Cyathus striatus]